MNELTYKLVAKRNAYNFGHDWTLVFKRGNTVVKEFWLGQSVKVVSRILGMRMDEAIKYYKEKSGSENFDIVNEYIAADILRAKLDTKRLTQEQLEKVVKLNNWELAVE